MTLADARKLVDYLETIDSHGVYAAAGIASDLAARGVDLVRRGRQRLWRIDGHPTDKDLRWTDVPASIQTASQTRKEMRDRGLGGHLDTSEDNIAGFNLSRDLCQLLLGSDPGGHLHGRGSAHRVRLRALGEWANRLQTEGDQ